MPKYLKRALSKLKETSIEAFDNNYYKIKYLGKYFTDSLGFDDYAPKKFRVDESALSSGRLIEKNVEGAILGTGLVLDFLGGLFTANYFWDRTNEIPIVGGEFCKTVGLIGGIITLGIGGVLSYVGVKDIRKYNKELKRLEREIGSKKLKALKKQVPEFELSAYSEKKLIKDVYSGITVELENIGEDAYNVEVFIKGIGNMTRSKKIVEELGKGAGIKSEIIVKPDRIGKREGILFVKYRDALNRKHRDKHAFHVDVYSGNL